MTLPEECSRFCILAIDDFRVGSTGGKTDWRSSDYDHVEGRFDVEIGAGANEVTIRT